MGQFFNVLVEHDESNVFHSTSSASIPYANINLERSPPVVRTVKTESFVPVEPRPENEATGSDRTLNQRLALN